MPPTDYVRFRLGPATLSDLDDLAQSAGSRSQALREATAYWHALVLAAAQDNAARFAAEDWERLLLVRQNLVAPLPGQSREEESRAQATPWPSLLVQALVAPWQERHPVLPSQKEEWLACRELASRVGRLDLVHGYAMMACLRYYWNNPQALTTSAWWQPVCWFSVPKAIPKEGESWTPR